MLITFWSQGAVMQVFNLDIMLAQLQKFNKTVYVLGDFNFNLFNDSGTYGKKFKSMVERHALQQLVSEATRNDSLLHLILTNDQSNISVQVKDTFISDHFLTVLVIPESKSISKYWVRKSRD